MLFGGSEDGAKIRSLSSNYQSRLAASPCISGLRDQASLLRVPQIAAPSFQSAVQERVGGRHARHPSAVPTYGYVSVKPPVCVRPRSLDRADVRTPEWDYSRAPAAVPHGYMSPAIQKTTLAPAVGVHYASRASDQPTYHPQRSPSIQFGRAAPPSPLFHRSIASFNSASIFPTLVQPAGEQSTHDSARHVATLGAEATPGFEAGVGCPATQIGGQRTTTPAVSCEPIVGKVTSRPTRGRGLIRDLTPLDSYRRLSRPRRPPPESARLTGGINQPGIETQPTFAIEGGPVKRQSSPPIAQTGEVLNEQDERRTKRLQPLTVPESVATSPSGALSYSESNSGRSTSSKKPLVPPLALNKVFSAAEANSKISPLHEHRGSNKTAASVGLARSSKNDQASAPYADDAAADDTNPDYANFGNLFTALPASTCAKIGRWENYSDLEFNSAISACEQSIHKFYKIPEGANRVFLSWVDHALRAEWIEESEDCHILLKPRLSRRTDQTWVVSHDFTIVNAMSTSELPSGKGCQTVKETHLWSRQHPFLVRVMIPGASYTIPIAGSQRRYYGFTVEGKVGDQEAKRRYYRYKRMPPGVRGAQRLLTTAFTISVLGDISEELRSCVLFRGEELYIGGETRDLRDRILIQVIDLLYSRGFRPLRPSPRSLSNPKTGCCGLIHDRSLMCLRLPELRVQTIRSLIQGLHTTKCFQAANQLLQILQPITHILPPAVKSAVSELAAATEYPTTSLLDRSIYLAWDIFSQSIDEWTLPFYPQ